MLIFRSGVAVDTVLRAGQNTGYWYNEYHRLLDRLGEADVAIADLRASLPGESAET